jgi:hypothetical protein
MLGVHHYSLLISSFEFGCIGVWLYALRLVLVYVGCEHVLYAMMGVPATMLSPISSRHRDFFAEFLPAISPISRHYACHNRAIIVNHSSTMAAAGAGAAYHHISLPPLLIDDPPYSL